MLKLRTYTVVPAIPDALAPLRELAHNLWYSWNEPARELFRRLDPDLWDDVTGNPVRLLAHVSQSPRATRAIWPRSSAPWICTTIT